MNHPPAPMIEELIERHSALLYRYAYRLTGAAADAEDLTQQTYLIAQQKLHQLREAGSAKSWLCAILRHEFLRLRRPRLRPLNLDEVTEPRQPDTDSTVDDEALQRALLDLPEEFRSAVILFYFQTLSYQEIADALQVPMGTVMSRLSRGKSLLRARLEKDEQRRSRRGLLTADEAPSQPLFPSLSK